MVALQVRKGLKKPQVADLLGVDIQTVRRVTKLEAETGSVVREPISKGPRQLLNGIDCAVRCVSPQHTHTQWSLKYLESLFERTPDLYLHKIQGDLIINRGIDVLLNTISRTLRKRGFTRKKLMIPAKEQNNWLRGEYLARIQQYEPHQLVFVDESSCDRRTSRRAYGWAPLGNRSRRRECFVRGTW